MAALSEIISFFKSKEYRIVNSDKAADVSVSGGRNIQQAGKNELTFLSAKYKSSASELFSASLAPLIIVDNELSEVINVKDNTVVVFSDDAKAAIVDCLTHFFVKKKKAEIHSTAIIHQQAKLGSGNSIGAYCVIEENVIIGNNCTIEPNVFIQSDCIIGNNVLIKSGSVIGGKGFGYVKNENGTWDNFPHFGRVILEDNVEIGSNTCIDRGALGDTVLKAGVKVDNLVHIAHNVVIGENSLIIADSMIGGSTTIGKNSWVSPSVSLKNGLTIGENSLIGMGAVVIKNVHAGETVVGNPAAVLKKK